MSVFESPDAQHSSEATMEVFITDDPECKECADLIRTYLSPAGEHELDEDELEDLGNHLLECVSCREQFPVAIEISDAQRTYEERVTTQRAHTIKALPSLN